MATIGRTFNAIGGRILIRTGQPGKSVRTFLYLMRGSGSVTVTYDSTKGGKVSKTIALT